MVLSFPVLIFGGSLFNCYLYDFVATPALCARACTVILCELGNFRLVFWLSESVMFTCTVFQKSFIFSPSRSNQPTLSPEIFVFVAVITLNADMTSLGHCKWSPWWSLGLKCILQVRLPISPNYITFMYEPLIKKLVRTDRFSCRQCFLCVTNVLI